MSDVQVSKFAFIVHPLTKNDMLVEVDREVYFKTPTILFRFFDRSAECLGLIIPKRPIDFVKEQDVVEKQIQETIRAAEEWGAQIVGLGGFTSIIGDGGRRFLAQAHVPLTSGNTLTAAIIVKSVMVAASEIGLDLSDSRIAVIGATGDIGSACSRALADLCNSLVLVARNEEGLYQLQGELAKTNPRISIERRPAKAALDADIVITVTSSITTLLEPNDLKKGAIVCDGAYPANIAREVRQLRKDVLVYEGGMVSWPDLRQQIPSDHPFWRFNLPTGVHGCFAETLLLALEQMFISYSLGRGDITQESMRKILTMAEKYDFSPAEYWHGKGAFTSQDLQKIRCLRSESTFRAHLN